MNAKDFKQFAKDNNYILDYYIEQLENTRLTKQQKSIINSIKINLMSYKLLSNDLQD